LGTSVGSGKRVVITAVGSLGDLHPYLAIALGLQARGHEAIIATSECYRQKVLALGLGFRPLRPDSEVVGNPDMMRRFMDPRRGTERVLRKWIMPVIRESYEDTLAAAQGADLLVSHWITFATRLVAEKEGISWASTMTTPACLFSAASPPLLPGYPGLSRSLRFLGPAFWGPLGHALKRATRFWAKPWYQLRRELGLPSSTEVNPLCDGHSPLLHLALFSRWFADKQPDWPPQTAITGFPFHDRDGAGDLPPELARFLDEGPPPLVFTLGSSAASIAGPFYELSAAAARRLGRRAVLILGDPRSRPASLPEGVAAFDYAPFGALFARALALVYPGGIGTTGLAMRCGLPMLVVPLAHDQPDNADRLTRLGIARTIDWHHYSAPRAAAELERLLEDREYARRAWNLSGHVRQEDGVASACEALEAVLARDLNQERRTCT
jgi:rhamnosyltransferase subunit B